MNKGQTLKRYDMKKIIITSIINFLIWCIPLAVVTKVLIGYYTVGTVMGLLCLYVAGPIFNIGISLYDVFEEKQ